MGYDDSHNLSFAFCALDESNISSKRVKKSCKLSSDNISRTHIQNTETASIDSLEALNSIVIIISPQSLTAPPGCLGTYYMDPH